MPKPRKSNFEEPYARIIQRLIERRKELGMNQTEFATLYGEDQSFISRVERLQRRIDVWEFVRLCTILKLRPGELLDGFASERTSAS